MRRLSARSRRTVRYMIVLAVIAVLAIPLAQALAAPNAQTSNDGTPTYQLFFCGLGLLVLVAAIIVRFTYGNFAPTTAYELQGKNQQEIVMRLRQMLPERSAVDRAWKFKVDKYNPNIQMFTTHPIPQWLGCVAMLITGILLGVLAYVLLYNLDVIRVVPLPDEAGVRIEAQGYHATSKARSLHPLLAN